jgi:large subunit ribosomal protein L19e
MNLKKKKVLASKSLGVGVGRVILNNSRLADIKEAITRQDMRDLLADGAISIREIKGRAHKEKRKTRRRAGSVRMKIKPGKREYVILTRKFRRHLNELRKQEKLSAEQFTRLRKEIKARAFKSLAQLKERIGAK